MSIKKQESSMIGSYLKFWPVILSGLFFTSFIYIIVFAIRKVFFKKDVLDLSEDLDFNITDSNTESNVSSSTSIENKIEQNSGIPKSLWTSKTFDLVKQINEEINNNPDRLINKIEEIFAEEVING